MSSFKIINTTNKNDMISNNLNEIESKEKNHSTLNRKCQSTNDNENITRNNAISIDNKNKNKIDNNKEGFHHSSNPSKKDVVTGKYIGKQPMHQPYESSKNNGELVVKRYDETSQFQSELIKEKQNLNGNGLGDKSKNNQNIVCIIPERKESKMPSLRNTQELFFPAQNVNDNNDSQPQIFINSPYSAIRSHKPEESQVKSNFENNTMLNGSLPVCLGMTTPNNPAPSSVMPVIDSDYAHNMGHDKGFMTTNNNQVVDNSDNTSSKSIKLESLFKGNNESSQNITEGDRLTQEQIMEVRNCEPPLEYKTNSIIEDEFHGDKIHDKGKGKSNQKLSKHSKKKDKSKHHTSINTNTDSNEIHSSSSLSSNAPKMSNIPSSPNMSDTKKKKWKSFKKLFGKKPNKKVYRHDNSSSSVIDDSRHNINSLTNSGINYDWNELRRRMEEEDSTVCTETLTTREFADAIGIQIISSSGEEEEMNDNDYSLLADVHSTTNSYYSTNRSTRSSGPPLDMSIFIPPTKEEKENLNNNNNNNNNNAANDKPILSHDAESEKPFSNVSKTDIINRMESNSKGSLFGDNQSIFTNNKINFQNLPDDFFNEVFENVTVSGTSSDCKKSRIAKNAHSLPYYSSSSDNQSRSKHSWFNTDGSGYDEDKEEGNNIDSMTDSKKINQNETNELNNMNGEINNHCHKSLERKKKTPSPEPIRTDIRDKKFKDDHLEDMSPLYKYAVNLEEQSPSVSIKSDDSVVQEYQKGRFTVTKENTTGSGHRVFIITKDEEDENGDSITTISSVSSLGKFTFRRRSSSQPASSLFTPIDPETKSLSSQKKANASLLKIGSSIPDLTNCDLNNLQHKSNSLSTSRSQVFPNNKNSCVVSDRRKSTISLDPSLLNNYSAFEKEDIEGHNDDCHSEHFELSENDSKLSKSKNNTFYSVETNKSSSHPNNSRHARGKKSNSRFQITYTPSSSAASPSLKSVHTMKSIESPSSKPINPHVSRLMNDDTNSIDQPTRGLSKSYTESSEIMNHSLIFNNFSEEEKIGHNASNSSSLLSSPTTSPRVSPFTSLRQPLNSNQRTVCSISSLLTENGSNSSSPPLTGVKIGSNYEASKPISIVNNSTYDHPDHNERLNSVDSSYFPPTPPKVQDTSSDYYNFFKYNDNYNSIILSTFPKDNDKPEKMDDDNKCTENILDELKKTENNEILTEVDKNMDLSESSSLVPYYQHNHSVSPLEKPPIVPNSPISGDESFNEIPSHARKASKASSISPSVKPSIVNVNTNSLSKKSNRGRHHRSPSGSSTKSTNTNGSSRFTVIRESNEKRSPSFSASKVVTKKFSNAHSSPLISPSDSLSSVNSVLSSKLKPSMVVIQGSDDKSKVNSTTSTQSTNIGRFTVTVTRETKIN